MNTFLKVLGVLIVPLCASIVAGFITKCLGGGNSDVNFYAGVWAGISYTMYMYEIGFIKKGFNV